MSFWCDVRYSSDREEAAFGSTKQKAELRRGLQLFGGRI